MPLENYESYVVESFIEDEDFIRFVKYAHPADLVFWQNILIAFPEKQQDFDRAKLQLSLILSVPELPMSPDFSERLWSDIELSIQENKHQTKVVRLKNIWLGVAAACLAFFAFGSWYFYSDLSISTKYGEQKLVYLPDGSKVRLNANSSITYPRAFNWKKNRYVNLVGEAYFEVKHLNQKPSEIEEGERFFAFSKELKVEVLGTTFNLKARPNINQVSLIAGSVNVTSIRSGASKILKPGEVALLDGKRSFEISKKKSLAPQVAWTGHKLLMAKTRIGDVIAEFENLYGYKVILPDTTMADRKIDGTISTASEESMLFVIKNILNVNVRQKDNIIYLDKR